MDERAGDDEDGGDNGPPSALHAVLRRAAGKTLPPAEEDGRALPSAWLSLPTAWSPPPADSSSRSSSAGRQEQQADDAAEVTWLYQPPSRDDPEWEGLIDSNSMRHNSTPAPHSYTLRLPFSFTRLSGGVVWPPAGLALVLNGEPVQRDAGSQGVSPFWTFDPPVAAGATVRLCWNTTEADSQITIYKSLSFT